MGRRNVKNDEGKGGRKYDIYESQQNELNARWTKINEGVHSLGWASQEEESWRKFEIVVGEYQWIVGY